MMKNIRLYFDISDSKSLQRIDDDTANDLNIDAFFECIDFTISSVGQQYLYNALRNIPFKSPFQEHDTLFADLDADEKLKTKIRKLLKRLSPTSHLSFLQSR
jgi:hypothetical protein